MVVLTKEEMEILFDLVFLGNWIVNSIRLENVKIKKYERFAGKIEKLHKHSLSYEEKVCCLDMFDLYFERLNKYIDEYDDEGCFPKLAEKLAKSHFPVNPKADKYYGSIHMQLDAQKIYEKELLEKGVSILSVDIPDILDRLEICRRLKTFTI